MSDIEWLLIALVLAITILIIVTDWRPEPPSPQPPHNREGCDYKRGS